MNKKSLFWWTLLGCISGYYCQVNAQSAYHINLDIPDKIIEKPVIWIWVEWLLMEVLYL